MNVRFVRSLALLTILGVASSAVAADPSSAAEKAAEAKRLAAQAAELAQRAASLAAESQASTATAATSKQIKILPTAKEAWTVSDAAEILISDADAGRTPTTVPSIGWRTPRKPSEMAIRFKDDPAPATAAATSAPIANSAPTAARSAAPSSELKLNAAELATEIFTTRDTAKPTRIAAKETAPAKTEATVKAEAKSPAKTASTATAPKLLSDEAILLPKAKIKDSSVRPAADDAEPMPAPPVPYDEPRLGGKEPCECVDGSCEVDMCCPPQRTLFWNSGVEATFLRPDLNDGFAAFSVEEFAFDRYDYFSSSTDDIDDLYMAPRIWIGVQGCLWGANLRYWHLRANEGSYDPTLGSDGEWDGVNCGIPNFGYTNCNDLEAYTVDLEITRRFCVHDCWMQFSAGVRHAEIEHNASLIATALADDSVTFGFAGAHRQTRGTGLVFGWYGRKPIFPCSCVHWFYNFHFSTLWGPTETAAETGVMLNLLSTDPDAVAAAGSINGASTAVDDNLFIGEIQFGLEWDYALRCLPANAFCRAALEYQRWSGGMGYSQANSFAGVEIDDEPTTFADAFALADAPELDLFGVSISTGLTW